MTYTFDVIKKDMLLRYKELITLFTVAIIGFTIGHIILRCVMAFDKSPDLTSFELGTLMAVFIVIFSTISVGAGRFCQHFNFAVSMGKRRSDIITAHIFVALIKGLFLTSLIYIFHIFENHICKTTYAEYPIDFDFNLIFTVESFFLILGVLVAMEIFFGAIQTKFGPKVFGIIWIALVWTISFGYTFIAQNIEENPDGVIAKIFDSIADFFNSINLNIIWGVCGIVMILFVAAPYVLLRKQRVTL